MCILGAQDKLLPIWKHKGIRTDKARLQSHGDSWYAGKGTHTVDRWMALALTGAHVASGTRAEPTQLQPSGPHTGNTVTNLYISNSRQHCWTSCDCPLTPPCPLCWEANPGRVGDATQPLIPLWVCPVGQTAADGRKGRKG